MQGTEYFGESDLQYQLLACTWLEPAKHGLSKPHGSSLAGLRHNRFDARSAERSSVIEHIEWPDHSVQWGCSVPLAGP